MARVKMMNETVHLISVMLLLTAAAVSEDSDDALIANVFQNGGNGGFNFEKGGCKCIPFYICKNGTQLRDGAGLIVYRLITPKCNCECQNYLERCCYVPPKIGPKDEGPTSTSQPAETSTDTATVITSKPKVTTKPKKKPVCGIRRADMFETRIMGARNKTKSSEFPWMVAIFHNQQHDDKSVKRFMCAGSLIHERVVMTVAHCAARLALENTVLRAGAWDLHRNEEPYPHQDRFVSQIIPHSDFNRRFVTNDIALLVTTTPFKLAINVDILCLPKTDDVVMDDSCIAAGWGKNESGEAPQYFNTEKSQSGRLTTPRSPYAMDLDFGGGVNYHFERHSGGIKDAFSIKLNPIGGSPLWLPGVISVASGRANPTGRPPDRQLGSDQPNPTGQYNASVFQGGMRYVELPIVSRDSCESKLQETRMGPYFTLHDSVMCAGGVPGIDTCQGDGGSPLICPIRSQKGRYQQVGIVAGGIGCGTDVPGLYANVAFLRPWIDLHVTQLGFSPAYYY